MKYVINQGVRDSIEELASLFERFDSVTSILSDRTVANSIATDAGFEKRSVESSIVSCAAKIISHATKGRRYPHMTKYRDADQW